MFKEKRNNNNFSTQFTRTQWTTFLPHFPCTVCCVYSVHPEHYIQRPIFHETFIHPFIVTKIYNHFVAFFTLELLIPTLTSCPHSSDPFFYTRTFLILCVLSLHIIVGSSLKVETVLLSRAEGSLIFTESLFKETKNQTSRTQNKEEQQGETPVSRETPFVKTGKRKVDEHSRV